VEFSGLILVGEQYAERPSDTFFTIIISHEMAHQWFYAGVGDDAIEHPWLDEGFATYLSYEFLYRYSSPAVAEAQRGTWRDTYQRAQQEWPHLTINDPTYAYPNSSIYSAFVYSGGATLLSTLRAELGDDLFYQAIQTYYKRFLHRIAIPSDLFGAFEDACGCDLDALLSPFGIER
jgi:aminopeptidase N